MKKTILSLSDSILELIDSGKISMGHARVLSKLDNVDKINYFVNLIIDKGLSVRDIEKLASNESKKRETKKREKSIIFSDYEEKFKSKYKANIKVSDNRIIIDSEDIEFKKQLLEKMLILACILYVAII